MGGNILEEALSGIVRAGLARQQEIAQEEEQERRRRLQELEERRLKLQEERAAEALRLQREELVRQQERENRSVFLEGAKLTLAPFETAASIANDEVRRLEIELAKTPPDDLRVRRRIEQAIDEARIRAAESTRALQNTQADIATRYEQQFVGRSFAADLMVDGEMGRRRGETQIQQALAEETSGGAPDTASLPSGTPVQEPGQERPARFGRVSMGTFVLPLSEEDSLIAEATNVTEASIKRDIANDLADLGVPMDEAENVSEQIFSANSRSLRDAEETLKRFDIDLNVSQSGQVRFRRRTLTQHEQLQREAEEARLNETILRARSNIRASTPVFDDSGRLANFSEIGQSIAFAATRAGISVSELMALSPPWREAYQHLSRAEKDALLAINPNELDPSAFDDDERNTRLARNLAVRLSAIWQRQSKFVLLKAQDPGFDEKGNQIRDLTEDERKLVASFLVRERNRLRDEFGDAINVPWFLALEQLRNSGVDIPIELLPQGTRPAPPREQQDPPPSDILDTGAVERELSRSRQREPRAFVEGGPVGDPVLFMASLVSRANAGDDQAQQFLRDIARQASDPNNPERGVAQEMLNAGREAVERGLVEERALTEAAGEAASFQAPGADVPKARPITPLLESPLTAVSAARGGAEHTPGIQELPGTAAGFIGAGAPLPRPNPVVPTVEQAIEVIRQARSGDMEADREIQNALQDEQLRTVFIEAQKKLDAEEAGGAAQRAATREHTVRRGETLSEIAARELGIPKNQIRRRLKEIRAYIKEVQRLNPDIVDPNKISVGQKIVLPPRGR